MTDLTILNGPNLNLLGEREPEIYGATTLPQIEEACTGFAKTLGLSMTFRQSNYEGQLIEWIHEVRKTGRAIIINPAGLSFHSVPLLDALKTFDGPIVEVHISNIHARDIHHRHSIISTAATSVICGLGPYGYLMAMLSAARMLGAVPDGMSAPLRTLPV